MYTSCNLLLEVHIAWMLCGSLNILSCFVLCLSILFHDNSDVQWHVWRHLWIPQKGFKTLAQSPLLLRFLLILLHLLLLLLLFLPSLSLSLLWLLPPSTICIMPIKTPNPKSHVFIHESISPMNHDSWFHLRIKAIPNNKKPISPWNPISSSPPPQNSSQTITHLPVTKNTFSLLFLQSLLVLLQSFLLHHPFYIKKTKSWDPTQLGGVESTVYFCQEFLSTPVESTICFGCSVMERGGTEG